MAKTPCRQCNVCNLYHNLAVEICDCGTDLKKRPVILKEENEIPGNLLGDFDTPVVVYVQTCPGCGTVNYSTDKQGPVRMCCNCPAPDVAWAPRVEYNPEAENRVKKPLVKENDERKPLVKMEQHQVKGLTMAQVPENRDEEEEDLGGEDAFWLAQLQKGIKDTASASYGYVPEEEVLLEEGRGTKKPTPSLSCGNFATEHAEDEEEEEVSWGDLGLKDGRESGSVPSKKSITLTAVRYGRFSFTVDGGQGDYMLGRSAMQQEFLNVDGRVGNEHCYLFYKNANWYVKDNHSRNGTAVNGNDIELNGESVLRDGDLLKLGHHADSVEFLVTIT